MARDDTGTLRLALISDPHGNLPALEAVLGRIDREGVDRILCAGDLVGYNPWPNEVVSMLRDRGVLAIRGNHDRAALAGKPVGFTPAAAEALLWTLGQLSPDTASALRLLEDRTRFADDRGTIALYHGSPRDDDKYVFLEDVTEDLVQVARARIVVLGHTHVPMFFACPSGIVVNPGSVGQPRDGDPRATYAMLDTATEEWRVERVVYDVGRVQREILRAGLPRFLADRLAVGR